MGIVFKFNFVGSGFKLNSVIKQNVIILTPFNSSKRRLKCEFFPHYLLSIIKVLHNSIYQSKTVVASCTNECRLNVKVHLLNCHDNYFR